MLRKTLSQTLNSEIEGRYPHNKSLLSYKRWSDSLRPPFRGMAHKVLKRSLEWWYEKPIYLHQKPMEEQIRIIRKAHGSNSKNNAVNLDRATDYVWGGDGDWHR